MPRVTIVFLLSSLLLVTVGCGPKSGSDSGKVIKSAPAGNNLSVELSTPSGVLKHGNEEFFLTFKDSSGKPVDVGAVSLNFFMPTMGTMAAMNDAATFTTTGTPGVYHGKANIETAGEWQAQITYDGPAGKGKLTVPVTAQ
jgi:YtkA-like protein